MADSATRPQTPPPIDDPSFTDNKETPRGLGLQDAAPPSITTDYDYDISKGMTDSPDKASNSGTSNDMLTPALSIPGGLSPNGGLYTPGTTPKTGSSDGTFHTPEVAAPRNPFNFTTVSYGAGTKPASASKSSEAVGKRRGHKYRHSSIHASHMDTMVQTPVPRTPLAVPSSLPMPTRREAWRSMTKHQTLRLAWCFCHFLVSAGVQYSAEGSLAMTALSRLLLFDAAGATVCVVVDVMGNFEVWKRSSLKHPFGLERADVLAGFGMAVFITFMGLDIFSHGSEHALENLGTHEPHTSHHHDRVPAGSVDIASLLAIFSTLISAILLKNHKRIGKAIRFSLIARWGRIFGNPSHFLTLSCSVLLLILPLLSIKVYTPFDIILGFCIAILMIAFGVRLGTSLASMLLMSYRAPSTDKLAVHDAIAEIETTPGISAVDEARFWQVHYGLCMANLKLRYRVGSGGYADDVVRIRQKAMSSVRQRLGGKWEVSVQMALEQD